MQYDSKKYDLSQIGLQFGDDFFGDGKSSFKFRWAFSSPEITSLSDSLKTLTKLDPSQLSYKLILEFVLENTNIEIFEKTFIKFINELGLTVKLIKDQLKITAIIGFSLEKEKKIRNMIGFLLSSGLNNLSKSHDSFIEWNIIFNKEFKELLPFLNNQETLISSLLQNSKTDLRIVLEKNLYTVAKEIFEKIDPDFIMSPPIILLQYFRNIDIDLRFQSTNELSSDVKKKLFCTEFFDKVPGEVRKIDQNDENITIILNSLGKNVKMSLFIPDLVSFKGEINAPTFSLFLKEYWGIIKSLIK